MMTETTPPSNLMWLDTLLLCEARKGKTNIYTDYMVPREELTKRGYTVLPGSKEYYTISWVSPGEGNGDAYMRSASEMKAEVSSYVTPAVPGIHEISRDYTPPDIPEKVLADVVSQMREAASYGNTDTSVPPHEGVAQLLSMCGYTIREHKGVLYVSWLIPREPLFDSEHIVSASFLLRVSEDARKTMEHRTLERVCNSVARELRQAAMRGDRECRIAIPRYPSTLWSGVADALAAEGYQSKAVSTHELLVSW